MSTPSSKMNRQILDEASAWFVDFRVGDIDALARERFDEWLRRSPEHIRAYMDIAKVYVALPALKADQKIDVDALISSARSDVNVSQLREAVPEATIAPDRSPRARTWAVAASLVVAVGLGVFGWLYLQRYPTYATDIGERRSITLADGSSVELNARSKIAVRFSNAERDIELLDGQALFEVAKDKARPFVVRAGDARVRAVGTEFDVARRASGTTVTVVEGVVSVSAPDMAPPAAGTSAPVASAVQLSAGEQLTVTAHAVARPKHADVAAATAWTQHRLIFDGARLSDVVDDFNRYNTRQLVIDDPQLNDFHISGVYSSTDPASLIRFLRAEPGVEVIETDQQVRITRN